MITSAAPNTPIRILVRGSSTVSWIARVEPGRISHAYPRELETAMHQHGWSVQVRASSPLAASSLHILRDADDDIFAWDPDVIVLNIGHMECLHMLIPRPIARHIFTRTARPGRWRQIYRRSLLWASYSVATKVQARLERFVEPWVFRRRRNAVIAHANQYIDFAARNGHPLIVVMGLLPPSTPVKIFPGLVGRLNKMNEAFRGLVAQRAEESVVWFDPADALRADGPPPEQSIGDGMHFTPQAHVTVGRGLARVVETWVTQEANFTSATAEPR